MALRTCVITGEVDIPLELAMQTTTTLVICGAGVGIFCVVLQCDDVTIFTKFPPLPC